jgi:cytochrome c oxidase cbb3-type subunit 2
MNRIVPIFILAFAILAFATLMLVIAPGAEIRRQAPAPGLADYTPQQLAGREQYVSLGCVYCHSQQPRSPGQSLADLSRGWGPAPSSADYAFDTPHQLGTMRTGPDLLNVGGRLPSRDWHLTHLYQPRAIFDWSIMPSYPFLFKRKKAAEPGDVVVKLPAKFQPEGEVVVASREALDLVAYLQSLNRTQAAPGGGEIVRDQGYALMQGAKNDK